MRKRWQYMLVPQCSQQLIVNVEDRLNRLGAEGWELCGIDFGCFIVKRPIQPIKEIRKHLKGKKR